MGIDGVIAAIGLLDHLIGGIVDGIDIVAIATGHRVNARPAVEIIVARAANQRVVAIEAEQEIVARLSGDDIVDRRAADCLAARHRRLGKHLRGGIPGPR